MLTLVLLAGIDSDPRTRALFEPAPIVHAAPAAAFTLEVPVLRLDAGVHAAADAGARVYDLDGDADLGLRVGDDDLSLAFAARLGLAHARGSFLDVDDVDGLTLPLATGVDGTLRAHADLGARFHIDLDDTEVALAYGYGLASVHDARGLASLDVALLERGDVVPVHASHRVDLDARVDLRPLASDPALRDDLAGKSALLVAGGARHDFIDGTRTFAWAGPGIALDGEALDVRLWAGPSLSCATDSRDGRGCDGLALGGAGLGEVATDVVGALEAALDADGLTLTARFDRRLLASPLHDRAIASGVALALSTSAMGLDLGASVAGAFVDVTGDDGVHADALVELRWPLFDLLVPMARVGAEALAFANGPALVRAFVLVGVEL